MLVVDAPLHTLGDLIRRLGGVAADRIRMVPAPGTAIERDIFRTKQQFGVVCELVDGTLVEKGGGFSDSVLAGAISSLLLKHVVPGNFGLVTGEKGTLRLRSGLVRIPDVAFVAWSRIPGGRVPRDPIPDLVPSLAVEVLSLSNTSGEMERKRAEYFDAGVELVWIVDPLERTVEVWTSPESRTVLDTSQILSGDPVLPGFQLSLPNLFAELDRTAG